MAETVTGEKLTILGGKNCLLCEEAKEAAENVLPRFGISYEYVNVRDDSALSDRYGDMIPVLIYKDQELLHGKVTEQGLLEVLTAAGLRPTGHPGEDVR